MTNLAVKFHFKPTPKFGQSPQFGESHDLQITPMAAESKTTFKNMLDCVVGPLIVRCHEPRAAVKHLSQA